MLFDTAYIDEYGFYFINPAAFIEVLSNQSQLNKRGIMENKIDKRNILDNEVFTYKVTKDKKVFIYYYEKQVKILSGNKAQDFIGDIKHAEGKEAQLIMAKMTGNFKRGNERSHKKG